MSDLQEEGIKRAPGRPTNQSRIADASREDGREPIRAARRRPREEHEKYDIEGGRQRGMDYIWAATKIPYTTQRSPRLPAFRRAGWEFCRAADHPDLSGYQPGEGNARMIELGIDDEVRADDPVIQNGLVLMMRPKSLSQEAEAEDKARAKGQIEDYMLTLRQKSERAIGPQRTRMARTYGPADEAATDAEVEM